MVFDDLVFHNAHAGLFHSKLGKRNACFVCGNGSGEKDFIHLFLRVGRKLLLCFSDTCNGGFQGFHTVNNAIVFLFHVLVLLK